MPLGQTVADQKQLTPATLRHLPRTYTVHLKNPTATDKTVPGLKTKMQADPTCQAPYPFPMWEQYGKADFDKFFASFKWTPGGRQGQGRGSAGRRGPVRATSTCC